MPTLLHISDLHRTSGPRLNNDDLLSAMVSDAWRWDQEGIPWPDLIVASGDMIQGTTAAADDPDTEIRRQYEEAADFLRRLAEEVVGGDLSRVVIVPGNHDVNWSRARRAMQPLSSCPTEIATEAFLASSNIRWNWKDQRAYQIVDNELYASRLHHFRTFRADFYAGLNPNPLSHTPNEDLAFFDYPELGLLVIGFASWFGNDCFSHAGEFDSESLALSRKLIGKSQTPLAVAVWHHNVEGGPGSHDYMDKRFLHRLIDFGFTLGFHGHQHYPGAAPFELRQLGGSSMTVVGAGSLAVGNSELPMGERRQFNIVVVDLKRDKITVHIRGMSPAGVFARSHRDDFGGNTFIELPLPRSTKRHNKSAKINLLDQAMTALTTKQYEQALEFVVQTTDVERDSGRQIIIEALDGLKRYQELLDILVPPRSADEVIRTVLLLTDLQRFDEAEKQLKNAPPLIDQALHRELYATIASRRMIS